MCLLVGKVDDANDWRQKILKLVGENKEEERSDKDVTVDKVDNNASNKADPQSKPTAAAVETKAPDGEGDEQVSVGEDGNARTRKITDDMETVYNMRRKRFERRRKGTKPADEMDTEEEWQPNQSWFKGEQKKK
jgi:small-conductance mechanosensitive channel